MPDWILTCAIRVDAEVIDPVTGFKEGILDIKWPWDTVATTPVLYKETRDGICFRELFGGMVSKGPGWEERFARLFFDCRNLSQQKHRRAFELCGDYKMIPSLFDNVLKYEEHRYARMYYQWWRRMMEPVECVYTTRYRHMNRFKLGYMPDYRIDVEFLARVAVLLLVRHSPSLFVDPYHRLLSFLVLTN